MLNPQPHDLRPTTRTVYSLEWLDFGPTGDTPRWLAMAFPNYEDETADRDDAVACYQSIAAQDPNRIRLVQTNHWTQIIAPAREDPSPVALSPTGASEVAVVPVWLTARDLTLLNYLVCLQRRQLETTDGDPEPIAAAIQSDGRPIAERVGFLTMQLLQLGAAVALTHHRLVFISVGDIAQVAHQALVSQWQQHLPTAQVYRLTMPGNDDCVVWQLYLPAHQGQPSAAQVKRAIAVAAAVGVTFDHQDQVYGSAYGAFISQHAGDLVTP